MRSFLLWCLFFAFGIPLRAQTIQVVDAAPSHGATGVPLYVKVSFTFSEPFSSASQLHDLVHHFGRFDNLDQGLNPQVSEDLTTITFSPSHLSDEDYTWLVYPVPTDTVDVQPFVLRYTTSDSIGKYTIRGTISVSQESTVAQERSAVKGLTARSVAPAYPLRKDDAVRDPNAGRARGTLDRTESPSSLRRHAVRGNLTEEDGGMADPVAAPSGASFVRPGKTDSEGSLIFLVDLENFDYFQTIAGIGIAAADGSYAIEYVREGTYLPCASKFAYGCRAGLIGAYDPDGDRIGNSISIPSDPVIGIDITLRLARYFAVTSSEAAAIARQALERSREIMGEGLVYAYAYQVDAEGYSPYWQLKYYSSSADAGWSAHHLAVFSVVNEWQGTARPPPETHLSSHEIALRLKSDPRVQAFLDEHASWAKSYIFRGGDHAVGGALAKTFPGHFLWMVTINATSTAGTTASNEEQYLTALLDMTTGETVEVLTFPGTAQQYEDWARAIMHANLPDGADPQLLRISHSSVDPETGEASGWIYDFAEESGVFNVDQVLTWRPEIRGHPVDSLDARPRVPDGYMDSDEALAIAEANGGKEFREAHPWYVVEMEGGYARRHIFRTKRTDVAERPVWSVLYWIPGGDQHSVFMDMTTGEIISPKSSTDADEEEPIEDELPQAVLLGRNYPNPFRLRTVIPFSLPASQRVTLKIYNLLGEQVSTLVDETRAAGEQQVGWEAEGIPSGVYFYRLETQTFTSTKKMIRVK